MIPVLIIEDHDENADDERDSKTSLGAAQYQQVPAQGEISLKPNALIAKLSALTSDYICNTISKAKSHWISMHHSVQS